MLLLLILKNRLRHFVVFGSAFLAPVAGIGINLIEISPSFGEGFSLWERRPELGRPIEVRLLAEEKELILTAAIYRATKINRKK